MALTRRKTLVSVGARRLSAGNGYGGSAKARSAAIVVSWGVRLTLPASASVPTFTGQRFSWAGGVHAAEGKGDGVGATDGDGVGATVGDGVGAIVAEGDGKGEALAGGEPLAVGETAGEGDVDAAGEPLGEPSGEGDGELGAAVAPTLGATDGPTGEATGEVGTGDGAPETDGDAAIGAEEDGGDWRMAGAAIGPLRLPPHDATNVAARIRSNSLFNLPTGAASNKRSLLAP